MGVPTAIGAGVLGADVLDIQAALDESGILSAPARSPRMGRSEVSGNIFVEDTRELGDDEDWAPATCGVTATCGATTPTTWRRS